MHGLRGPGPGYRIVILSGAAESPAQAAPGPAAAGDLDRHGDAAAGGGGGGPGRGGPGASGLAGGTAILQEIAGPSGWPLAARAAAGAGGGRGARAGAGGRDRDSARARADSDSESRSAGESEAIPGASDQGGLPDDQEPDWEEYSHSEDDPGKTHYSIQ